MARYFLCIPSTSALADFETEELASEFSRDVRKNVLWTASVYENCKTTKDNAANSTKNFI